MTRGRKVTPLPIKERKGTVRPCRLNDAAPDAEILKDVPPPPDWLDQTAKAMWLDKASYLVELGILTNLDLHNLEVFCTAYSQFREAELLVSQQGLIVEGATGGPIKNPALTAKKEAQTIMASFGSSLGLDPSARSRLVVDGKTKPKGNSFDGF